MGAINPERLFRSEPARQPAPYHDHRDFLFFDPDDKRTLFMGGAGPNPKAWYGTRAAKSYVMRSADGGRSWREPSHGMPDPMAGPFEAMARHVWDGGTMLIIGTAMGESYRSEDAGAGWRRIADGLPPVFMDNHHLPLMSEQVRRRVAFRPRTDKPALLACNCLRQSRFPLPFDGRTFQRRRG